MRDPFFTLTGFRNAQASSKEWFATSRQWHRKADDLACFSPREAAIVRDLANAQDAMARMIQQWEQGK